MYHLSIRANSSPVFEFHDGFSGRPQEQALAFSLRMVTSWKQTMQTHNIISSVKSLFLDSIRLLLAVFINLWNCCASQHIIYLLIVFLEYWSGRSLLLLIHPRYPTVITGKSMVAYWRGSIAAGMANTGRTRSTHRTREAEQEPSISSMSSKSHHQASQTPARRAGQAGMVSSHESITIYSYTNDGNTATTTTTTIAVNSTYNDG